MGSKNREVRQRQLEQAVARLEARQTELTERGLDPKLIAKDPVRRKRAAELREARGRIASMDAAEEHVKEVAAKPKGKDKSKGKGKGKGKGEKGGGKGKQPKKGK